MAPPFRQAVGTVVRDTVALTVAWPTPHVANDVALLFVETANQAPTLSTPAGFVQVTQQGTGTAGTSGATMLTVFWCRATSSSMASPVVQDSGDHQVAVIVTFRGCITTGNPWDVFAGAVQASPTTNFSIPTVTTTVADALVVLGLSNNGDATTNEVSNAPANSNLTNIVEVIDTQPLPLQSTKLRFGPYGQMSGLVATGPGGDLGAPIYGMVGINPFDDLTTIGAQIDLADTNDVTLFVLMANDPSNYGVHTAGGFVLGCSDPTNLGTFDAAGAKSFCGQLKRLATAADWAKLQDAFARNRAIAYVGDEPYHVKWLNSSGAATWTPTLVNKAARAVKTIVGGPVLTFLRGEPSKLASGSAAGWNNLPVPTYDALDYATMQFEGPNTGANQTFAQAVAAERTPAATINVGLFTTLNLWVGGNRTTVDGVAACWDYLNTGSSSGVIAGTAQPSTSIFSPGQQIDCATWTATPTGQRGPLVASPTWIRRIIDTNFNDPDIPWLGFWTHANASIGSIWPWAGTLESRSDFVAALDYVINKGLTRSSATALRTPKT